MDGDPGQLLVELKKERDEQKRRADAAEASLAGALEALERAREFMWGHGLPRIKVVEDALAEHTTPATARLLAIVTAAERHARYRCLGSAAHVSIAACDCDICKAVRLPKG
ncbi:hypothetical protein LCGC14_0399470 [marine sediment metagenome]|uniref:Uncharacterized protein n=1 Tax=marine sediment metagenome TaxID=412755 RepID=A0A0F9SX61_9ZZZZ